MENIADDHPRRIPLELIEGPLQTIVNTLVLNNDDKCKSLIRLLRLIETADDDDKSMVISTAIEYAYGYTRHHYDCYQQFLEELYKEPLMPGWNEPASHEGESEPGPLGEFDRSAKQQEAVTLILRNSTPDRAIDSAVELLRASTGGEEDAS